jgi:hypothetical protein
MRFSTLLPLAFLLAAALPAASQNFQKVLPSFSPALSSYARVEWVDADGDKDLDVLAFYHDNYNYANSFVKLYENKEPAFQEVVNSFGASEKPVPISYSTGDYDLDGDVDVLLVDKGTLRIARNNGNLSFSMEAVVGIAEQRGEAQWVNVDADSDLDIYYAGSVAPKSQDSQGIVLVNQLIAGGKGLANQPPASPTGLTARQDEHGMHLGWMPAADDHTPPTGVTYDVILYKGTRQSPRQPWTRLRVTASGLLLDGRRVKHWSGTCPTVNTAGRYRQWTRVSGGRRCRPKLRSSTGPSLPKSMTRRFTGVPGRLRLLPLAKTLNGSVTNNLPTGWEAAFFNPSPLRWYT